MAIILHKNIIEANLHPPKGFNLPSTNSMSYPIRSESDVAIYQNIEYLPAAINFVDGNNPPPTAVLNDIYVVIDGGGGVMDAAWNGITFNSWARFDSSSWNGVNPVNGYQCYDKTSNEYKSFDGSVWAAAGGGATGGVVGIPDALGVFTYYASFSAAMTAAVAGNTIFLFANIIEPTTTILKTGVNIVGNGFSVTNATDDGTDTVQVNANYEAKISDIDFIRTGRSLSASGIAFNKSIGGASTFKVEFSNTRAINDYGHATYLGASSEESYCDGLKAYGYTYGIYSATTLRNCYGFGEITNGIFNLTRTSYDSFGESITGAGFQTATGNFAYRCHGKSVSGIGITGGGICYDCHALSATSWGVISANIGYHGGSIKSTSFTAAQSSYVSNCFIESGSYISCYRNSKTDNCTVVSHLNAAVNLRGAGYEITNSTVRCNWNNASGHAVKDEGVNVGSVITNCTLEVVNASANGINVNSGIWANNVFKGSTAGTSGTNTAPNATDARGNTKL